MNLLFGIDCCPEGAFVLGKATPNFKMLPSLERAIMLFLSLHILSGKIHMIFIVLVSNHYF